MKETALITGASSGIGKEMCILHAQAGKDLVIIARNEKDLNGLKAQLESQYDIQVHVISKDLTDATAVDEIIEDLEQHNIQVEYLINNAGFGKVGMFADSDWETSLSMIQLNVIALSHLCRRILPQMLERNSGRILNVSSTASLMPGPLQAVYFASKAFVRSFSNALSEELKESNITVTNLMPGATETNFAKTAGLQDTALFDDTASAHSVASTGYKAMMEGKMDVTAGITLGQSLMLKAIPFTPKKLVLNQVRKMQEDNS
ncbi:short-chain dehydrogenase [Nonlabens sp. YIK11]|uniref:SDR family NAD(P)-dependent oxidoreductase n=1 Tax=Nonlabens sp. YIK11 TaxID=1453349 RepID=UPI0006DC7A8A|nr:SDR family oxidoreductase [Nonlabens sp. YIK11]KQC32986.1 short-chain dehydrogenase [Nonlabens sp. YIK11]